MDFNILEQMGFTRQSNHTYYQNLNGIFVEVIIGSTDFKILAHYSLNDPGQQNELNSFLGMNNVNNMGSNFGYVAYVPNRIEFMYYITNDTNLRLNVENALGIIISAGSRFPMQPVCTKCGKTANVRIQNDNNGMVSSLCDECGGTNLNGGQDINRSFSNAFIGSYGGDNQSFAAVSPITANENRSFTSSNAFGSSPMTANDNNFGSSPMSANHNFGSSPMTVNDNNFASTPMMSNTNTFDSASSYNSPSDSYDPNMMLSDMGNSNDTYGNSGMGGNAYGASAGYGSVLEYSSGAAGSYSQSARPANTVSTQNSGNPYMPLIIAVAGGLGGGFLGGLLWVIFSFFGRIVFISGIAAGWIAVRSACTGYIGTAKRALIAIVLSLFVFGIGIYLGAGVDIYQALNDPMITSLLSQYGYNIEGGFSYGEALGLLPFFFAYDEFRNAFFIDLALGALTYVVGAVTAYVKNK